MRSEPSGGCQVDVVDSGGTFTPLQELRYRARFKGFRMGLPVPHLDAFSNEARLLASASQGRWDVVWLEKALTVGRAALQRLHQLQPEALVVGFSPDDMNARHNQSLQFLQALPHYDYFLTTKIYNVLELRERGCLRVRFVGNGYDPEAFRPVEPRPDDRERFGGDIGFMGSYERERAESLLFLAEQGLHVRVWGGGPWSRVPRRPPTLRLEHRPLLWDDFARACQSFKINLGFLRKVNRDLQTTRSVEIPACGGFMLAERTTEHLAMFREGEEAEFFDSNDELLEKCQRYLEDEPARKAIAARGRQRCIESGYSNEGRLREALTWILGIQTEHS
jgi:spore maturation protein CgeB